MPQKLKVLQRYPEKGKRTVFNNGIKNRHKQALLLFKRSQMRKYSDASYFLSPYSIE